MAGTMIYDYDELTSVDKALQALVARMTETAQSLKSQVQQTVGADWQGEQARSYETKVNELNAALQNHYTTLEAVDNQFVKNTGEIQNNDSSGSRRIANL